MVKLAAVAGVSEDLPCAVTCMGRDRLPNFDTADAVAVLRKYALVGEEARPIYREIVKATKAEHNETGYAPGAFDHWIDAWLELDQGQGVKYSSTILNPYEAFFSGMDVTEVEKLASTTILLRDVMIPVTDFSAIPDKAFTYNFEPETAADLIGIQKMAAGDVMEANRHLAEYAEKSQKALLRVLAES